MCSQPAWQTGFWCDRRLWFVIKVRYGRARTEVKRKNAGRGGREGGREKKSAFFLPLPFPSFSRLTSAQLSCGRISYYKSHKRTTQKTLFIQAYVFIIPEVSQTNRDCNQDGKEYRQLSCGLHKGVRCIRIPLLLYTTALLRYNSCHCLIRDHVALKELRHGFLHFENFIPLLYCI